VDAYMSKKKRAVSLGLFFILSSWIWTNNALAIIQDPGATLQISTHFSSFVGRSSWLIVIQDLDHGQNIPFLYDIKKPDNYWLAFTSGRHYRILASTLRIHTHGTNQNRYQQYTIKNFCNLESNGRIIRNQSIYIRLTGDLTSNRETIDCGVSRFTNAEFNITN
jgi:hypothetical protein